MAATGRAARARRELAAVLLLRWSRLAQQFIDFVERVTAEGAETNLRQVATSRASGNENVDIYTTF